MKIDCERCPARTRACDDCMMQVFFPAVTSEYAREEDVRTDEIELVAAIAVFADTDLVSADSANQARLSVTAGDGDFSERRPLRLRAV